MKVFWSDAALAQLEEIYNYYKVKASPAIARKLIKTLIEKTILLESNPLIGVIEPLLSKRNYEYRFLIENNYKIIYRYFDNYVKINLVFDCRQNPDNIEKISDLSEPEA